LVGLAGDPLGLLGGDFSGGEPGDQVTRVELHLPLAFDHLGHAAGRPEIGREAELTRAFAKPSEDDVFPTPIEFAVPPRRRLGLEAFAALLLGEGLLVVDGAYVDAEEFGDLLSRVPLLEAFHCEESPAFEFGCRAGCSHAPSYARGQEILMRL
jgi:hypothetical protein